MGEEFDLSHLAVEDALAGHQRAKLEHYGETLFLVLRPARYLDDLEKVEFGEIHVFAGTDFAVTVRGAESPDLARVRRRMESDPDFLALGPDAVLYAIRHHRISSWAAILFAPTLIGTIYGMNFRSMPELDWVFGYPMALGLMLGMGLALFWMFKRNKWI